MSLCLCSTRHGSSVTLITRCQEKVDVTNQHNFNLNAALQWWISQGRTTKSRLNIMNLRLDYIWSYFPHGNSAFGTSKENVTHSLFWHWFFLWGEKKKTYVKWFSLQSLGKSGVMMVGSWDHPYFKFVILKIIVKAENVLPHLSKQSFCLCIGKSQGFFWVLSDGIRKKIWLWQNWRRIIIHLHKWCMHRSIDLALFRAPSIENLYDSTVNSVTLPFTYIGKLSM
jgi:hypothetical protein